MASGTITFGASGYLQGKIEWSSISNGSSANSSNVTATLYARRTNNATTTGRNWSGYVSIEGNSVSINFSSSVSISSNWVQMATNTIVVSHNDNGTKQITISGSVTGPSGTSLAGNTSSGTDYPWLDTIPRYVTIDAWDVGAIDENRIRFAFSASDTCDYAWYSLDNGSNWVGVDIPDSSVGNFVVSGLNAGTTYNCVLRLRRQDSQLVTTSDTKQSATYNYPYCLEAPDFTIGNNITISLYNPLNRTVQIQMWSHISQQFVSDLITITGTSYTGFSDVDNRLYASIPNNTSSKYNIDVWYGNNKAIKEGGYYSIRGDENPIFSDFDYEDNNNTTTALTGNNKILIKNYSSVKAIISTSNKAIAVNNATMQSYQLNVGSKTTTANYSGSSTVELIVDSIDNNIITVSATDSRGLSTLVSKTATYKEYSDLIITSVTATRSNNGVGEDVTLAFSGTFWNNSFGSVTNSITEVT